jgi:hypothetical protein
MQDDFRFFKLGLGSRLALAGGLFAAGVALELAASVPAGLLVALCGWAPLLLRKATNKPDDQGLEEWRPVPMSEIDRLVDGIGAARKLRRKTMNVSAGLALGLGVPAFLVLVGVASAMGRNDLAFILANAAIFLAPSAFFGRVKVFTPSEISMKLQCFCALFAEALPEGVALAPYIRFDKDKSGADVPEDLRIMYELKRSPADLVGIQMQAAINNGANGPVPYMYAVVLTKGKGGPSYAVAERARHKGYEVEPGGDEEYGTVVIRQETSGSGYETSPEDCVELRGICLKLLKEMAAKA